VDQGLIPALESVTRAGRGLLATNFVPASSIGYGTQPNGVGMKAVLESSIGFAAASLLAASSATAAANTQPAVPPKAAQVTAPIQQVELGPVFADRYLCVEHALELEYAGDALGTDCVLSGGVEIGRNGFLKLYRTDGTTNADWYGWHADVLAPFDGTVVYLHHEAEENVPGVLGPSSAAGSLRFRNGNGVIVTYVHVSQIAVKVGDRVKAGQVVAKLGNNGQTRAPGIHIGAYREADAMPLQIRWDLRAMAKKRAEAGIR
jgi:murein DD-endopeptidase MepM/ murein hydrolase activator NlpD